MKADQLRTRLLKLQPDAKASKVNGVKVRRLSSPVSLYQFWEGGPAHTLDEAVAVLIDESSRMALRRPTKTQSTKVGRPTDAIATARRLVPMIVHHGPSLQEHCRGCPHEECDDCPASRETHGNSECEAPEGDECSCGAWEINDFYLTAVELAAHVLGDPYSKRVEVKRLAP